MTENTEEAAKAIETLADHLEAREADGVYVEHLQNALRVLETRDARTAALEAALEEAVKALELIAEHFERSPGNSEPAHMAKNARAALATIREKTDET